MQHQQSITSSATFTLSPGFRCLISKRSPIGHSPQEWIVNVFHRAYCGMSFLSHSWVLKVSRSTSLRGIIGLSKVDRKVAEVDVL